MHNAHLLSRKALGARHMNRLHEGFVLGGRYRLESRIASGGMADVWSATDDVLQRTVAVKIMRPDAGHEELFARRFRDEAVNAAGLNHTNIATVFDYGEDDGLAFLVMEHVEGRTLSALMAERGPLPASEVRSILGQAALALGVAHHHRVVHRDIKPPNILVREDGLVKLTDFGIARALDASGHTKHGEMLGTPNYISPEQVRGEPATGEAAMDAAEVHRRHIANRFYDLDHEFHRGLADLYVSDPRFTKSYEDLEPGLAVYVRDAIHANSDRHAE